ncbi:MAG: serine/threonine-protein kinase, partial [Polyangiales bacterium]
MNETATWLMHDANNEDPRVEPLGQSGIMTPTRVLLGKYRLGRLLGEGGMGAVYEAEHLGLGTPVAVKMLNDRFVADPKSQVRFRREARAAAAVRHPNVVAVTDTGTDEEGLPFIVMERLEGESLASVLRRKRVLPYTVASAVATQVLAGLEAAHTRGVMHRDLKPGNIFITQSNDGQYCVKIVDFGISKFTDDCRDGEVTADGALLGT